MSLIDVKKNLAALPWVKPAKDGVPCDGIKWSTVALRDIYSYGGHPARGIQDRSRCKRRAKWVFRPTLRRRLGEHPAEAGSYCTLHLSMQINDHEPEYRRAVAFWEKNGWWRNGVFGKHEIGGTE